MGRSERLMRNTYKRVYLELKEVAEKALSWNATDEDKTKLIKNLKEMEENYQEVIKKWEAEAITKQKVNNWNGKLPLI